MTKYSVAFYDTAIYWHEFEVDFELDEDNITSDDRYEELIDEAWKSFNIPTTLEVDTMGDWSMSDDPYDIIRID